MSVLWIQDDDDEDDSYVESFAVSKLWCSL